MAAKWIVVHAHYKGEPPKRSDFDAALDEKEKIYKCPKCKKVVAGIERGRHTRLYIIAKDVVVDFK